MKLSCVLKLTDTREYLFGLRLKSGKMPFQIVVTSELQGAECAACRALTDKAQEADIEQVIDDATSETVDVVREYYRIFLNLIAEKNPEVFEEIRRGAACQWHAFSADRNGE